MTKEEKDIQVKSINGKSVEEAYKDLVEKVAGDDGEFVEIDFDKKQARVWKKIDPNVDPSVKERFEQCQSKNQINIENAETTSNDITTSIKDGVIVIKPSIQERYQDFMKYRDLDERKWVYGLNVTDSLNRLKQKYEEQQRVEQEQVDLLQKVICKKTIDENTDEFMYLCLSLMDCWKRGSIKPMENFMKRPIRYWIILGHEFRQYWYDAKTEEKWLLICHLTHCIGTAHDGLKMYDLNAYLKLKEIQNYQMIKEMEK